MNNEQLLEVIKQSFNDYLRVGTSRSPQKLKSLHGSIAQDLEGEFGPDFTIKSQGIGDDKEGVIPGRYYDKNVDITVFRDSKPVAGYAVKFVMCNYSQNSNNYFENMLGETANIRANNIPYYQIFIIFDKVPYYKNGGKFVKYEKISGHNLSKYLNLSEDDPNINVNVPDKTLVIILKLKEKENDYVFENKNAYNNYYIEQINKVDDLITYSSDIDVSFGPRVILNNYKSFIDSTVGITCDKLNQEKSKN